MTTSIRQDSLNSFGTRAPGTPAECKFEVDRDTYSKQSLYMTRQVTTLARVAAACACTGKAIATLYKNFRASPSVSLLQIPAASIYGRVLTGVTALNTLLDAALIDKESAPNRKSAIANELILLVLSMAYKATGLAQRFFRLSDLSTQRLGVGLNFLTVGVYALNVVRVLDLANQARLAFSDRASEDISPASSNDPVAAPNGTDQNEPKGTDASAQGAES